jgi:hypothetical protein
MLLCKTLLKLSFDSVFADPGCLSRIADPTFTHPGSRGKKGAGSQIRNTGLSIVSFRGEVGGFS